MTGTASSPEFNPREGRQPAGGPLDYRDPEWAADELGIDKQTVYKYLQDGTLPGLQLGRKWLISERALARYLDEEQRRQTAARRAGMHEAPGSRLLQLLAKQNAQDDARYIIGLAQGEAQRLNHNYLDQEHLLLAFAEASESTAAKTLASLGIDSARLKGGVEAVIGAGAGPPRGGRRPTP